MYQDPEHKPHDTWLGFPSYGWIPDNSQNNNNGPAQASYNLPPFKTTISFYWGMSSNIHYYSSSDLSEAFNTDIREGAVYFDTIRDDGNTFEYLPNGDYRILISLLKPGSDATVVSDWETWLSPVIRLEGDWRNT
jgi:predicted heme/steroid binding protein